MKLNSKSMFSSNVLIYRSLDNGVRYYFVWKIIKSNFVLAVIVNSLSTQFATLGGGRV